jgi:hypothetical protein
MMSSQSPPPWLTGVEMPLINRLIERSQDATRVSFNDASARAISTMRRYSATSVANAAINAMQIGQLNRVDRVRSAPWLSALLLKWKLLNTAGPLNFGRDMPQAEFDRLRQMLWLADAHQDPDAPGFNAMTMVRALMAVQMEFQRLPTSEFMRWPALIARLPREHVNRRQFEEAIGMDPETFMDLCMVTHTAVVQSPIVQRSYFDPIRAGYGAKVDTYLALVSRTLPDLRDELRADSSQATRVRSEVHELPYVRRYPLLQLHDQRLASWHPDVLARGLEDATHLRMSKFGDAYSQVFGRVFERYVLELLTDAGIPFVPEDALQRQAGPLKAVEALIESDGCNVYVEAKMGLFADQLLIRDDPTFLYERTKNIRTAIAQGWEVSDWIRSGAASFGESANANQDFLLVVTSRELYLGGGLILQRLYPPGRFDYPEGDLGMRIRSTFPLQNVFIVSINEFEILMGHIQASGRSLAAILRGAAAANADPQTSAYTLGMHLHGVPGRRGPALLRDAMNACGERLQRVLDPSNPIPWAVRNNLAW